MSFLNSNAKLGIDAFGVGIIDGINFVALFSNRFESKQNVYFSTYPACFILSLAVPTSMLFEMESA